MFFRLVTSVGQRKNSESPWGNEPQTFAFRAPMPYHWGTETPRWVRSITKFIFFICPTLVTRRKNIFLYFFTELKTYLPSLLFLSNENFIPRGYKSVSYDQLCSKRFNCQKIFCEYKASLVWHKGLDDIRRFVCQSKYFVSSIHRKKRVTLLYQLSCSFELELNCIRFVEELY